MLCLAALCLTVLCCAYAVLRQLLDSWLIIVAAWLLWAFDTLLAQEGFMLKSVQVDDGK